jgi:hypothetical protein
VLPGEREAMSETDRFAALIVSGEKTHVSPAVVGATALLVLGFVVSLGYRLVLTVA